MTQKTIQKDDILVIFAGERIPADGIVIKGEGSIDNSALNGESIPQNAKVGDSLLSGGINLDGILHLKATKSYETPLLAKLSNSLKRAMHKKAKARNLSPNLPVTTRPL